MLALSLGYLAGGRFSLHNPSLARLALLLAAAAITALPVLPLSGVTLENLAIAIPDPRFGSLAAAAAAVLGTAHHAGAQTLVENSAEFRMQLDFKVPDAALQTYLRQRLETFALSATALNRFLTDPQQFLRIDLLGQPEQALAPYEAALDLARRTGDRHREGSVLANLGNEYAEMGIMDKALLHDEAAIAVAREVGNRRLEGNTLCNLGLLHQVQGRFSEALDQLEAALAVACDVTEWDQVEALAARLAGAAAILTLLVAQQPAKPPASSRRSKSGPLLVAAVTRRGGRPPNARRRAVRRPERPGPDVRGLGDRRVCELRAARRPLRAEARPVAPRRLPPRSTPAW